MDRPTVAAQPVVPPVDSQSPSTLSAAASPRTKSPSAPNVPSRAASGLMSSPNDGGPPSSNASRWSVSTSLGVSAARAGEATVTTKASRRKSATIPAFMPPYRSGRPRSCVSATLSAMHVRTARRFAPLALAGALHSVTLPALAQPAPKDLIQRGHELFDDQRYEESIQTLSGALVRPSNTA